MFLTFWNPLLAVSTFNPFALSASAASTVISVPASNASAPIWDLRTLWPITSLAEIVPDIISCPTLGSIH